MRDLLARKMFHYMIATILIYILGFIFVPVIITKLGLIEFGLYSSLAIFSIGGYISLVEMGLQTAAVKYAAEYYEAQKYEEIKILFSSIILIYLFLGLLIAVFGYISINFIMNLMRIPSEYLTDFAACLKITFLSFFVSFPTLAYVSVLKGLQKFVISKNIELAVAALKAVGVLVLLALNYRLTEIVLFYAFLQVLQLGFYVLYARRTFDFLRFNFGQVSLAEIGKLTSMSRIVFWGQLSSVAFQHTDRLLISVMLGPQSLGFYEAIMKIPSALKSFTGQLNTLLMPISSSVENRDNSQKILKTLFSKALRYQLVVTMPLLFWIALFSKELLKLWLGDSFLEHQSLLVLALFWNVLLPYFNVGASILLGHNKKTKELIRLSLVSAAMNLGFNILLIHYFNLMGIVGATLLSLILVLPLNFKIYQEEIKFDFQQIVRDFFRVVGIGIVCGSVYYLVKTQLNFEINQFMVLLASLLLWCVAYYSLIMLFVLDSEDRKLILNLFKKPTA